MTSSAESSHRLVGQFESMIRSDVCRRGLISSDGTGPGFGELLRAASELAPLRPTIRGVCLVTGFFVPCGLPATVDSSHQSALINKPGHAETDGPLGTAMLARVLNDLGWGVRILTDDLCADVVGEAADVAGLVPESVIACPLDSQAWRHAFFKSEFGASLTDVISIERVGPSHTRHSLIETGCSQSVVDEFDRSTRPDLHDHCFNMRGVNIDEWTGDLHKLFEDLRSLRPDVRTVGIGDGGNEIGMGRFCWSELRSRLPPETGAVIPCRIKTDHSIVAGVSNWGAYALAAAIGVLAGRIDVLERHTVASQAEMLETIVSVSGAVDGISRKQEPTVDGLSIEQAFGPLREIRRLLGLSDL